VAKTVAIKPEENFARSYADRLILEKLTEMESAMKLGELADKLTGAGLGLAAVRSLLASNPERFAYHERRWVPASRLESTGRPFSEAITLVLRAFGAPMSAELLIRELARVRNISDDEARLIVERLLKNDRAFVVTEDGKAALQEWSFDGRDETVDRALEVNGVTREEFDTAAGKLGGHDWRAPGAIAAAIAKSAPVRVKTLGAVAWSVLNPQDPRSIQLYDARDFLRAVLSAPGFVIGADHTLHPETEAKKWVTTAVKLADRLAPTIDLEDAAPIEVKPEAVGQLVGRVKSADGSVTATRLLEEFYEITPGAKTFPDDLANVMDALRDAEGIQWVGGDRFRKSGDAPDFIYSVPEPFHFQESGVRDDEGELVDVELTDEGLSSSLRKLLQHPLAVDVLDEDPTPAPKTMPENVRLVLKSIHRELGTFPLAQISTGYLQTDPSIQELIFIDPDGRELQVWVNHEARLLYNLIDWWYDQPVESGSVFTLNKTGKPNVFDFEWLDQPDPVVYISNQRMEELRQLGLEAEGKSTLSLLVEVMGHWPKGADYLTILAEVNVVRRTSRRLVASLLSSYHCFYQRSGSPVWHYDAKKVDQGFDKTKKKFIKK
jgi:hypothetical protein